MTTTDEQDAIKALTYRLTQWGVDQASDKARQFIRDLTARGWQMAANVRPIRRPPMPSEECPDHIGEFRDLCRCCVSERKAAREEAAQPTGHWTVEQVRAEHRRATTAPTDDRDEEQR